MRVLRKDAFAHSRAMACGHYTLGSLQVVTFKARWNHTARFHEQRRAKRRHSRAAADLPTVGNCLLQRQMNAVLRCGFVRSLAGVPDGSGPAWRIHGFSVPVRSSLRVSWFAAAAGNRFTIVATNADGRVDG